MFATAAVVLWFVQKYGYRYKNSRKAREYSELTKEQQLQEDALVDRKGNRSLLFRFTT